MAYPSNQIIIFVSLCHLFVVVWLFVSSSGKKRFNIIRVCLVTHAACDEPNKAQCLRRRLPLCLLSEQFRTSVALTKRTSIYRSPSRRSLQSLHRVRQKAN